MDRRAVLEDELRAEVAPVHELFGVDAIAIAHCVGCDEVVFSVEVEQVRFARVRLMWSGVPERPPLPLTEKVLLPLHRGLPEHDH